MSLFSLGEKNRDKTIQDKISGIVTGITGSTDDFTDEEMVKIINQVKLSVYNYLATKKEKQIQELEFTTHALESLK